MAVRFIPQEAFCKYVFTVAAGRGAWLEFREPNSRQPVGDLHQWAIPPVPATVYLWTTRTYERSWLLYNQPKLWFHGIVAARDPHRLPQASQSIKNRLRKLLANSMCSTGWGQLPPVLAYVSICTSEHLMLSTPSTQAHFHPREVPDCWTTWPLAYENVETPKKH